VGNERTRIGGGAPTFPRPLPSPSVRYGEFEIHALPEGRFTVGLDKVFVPYRAGDPPRPGTLFVAVCPFAVVTPADVLLLDCGLGSWARGRSVDVLLDNLRRAGVERERVTRVLLSHLHFDHAGGAVFEAGGAWQPTFPRAEYVVQRGELDAPYTGESARARDLVVRTLDAAGQLATVEGDGWLTPEVEYAHTNGHTRDHELFRLHTAGRTAVYAGDVLATPGQVARRFVAKYDFDGPHAAAERERVARAAAEGGHLLLFYHSPEAPAAFLAEGPKGGLAVEPVAL
jgi:glyoxylase-like metal-dependent hydrolase (beta-lactamase superfamily II)